MYIHVTREFLTEIWSRKYLKLRNSVIFIYFSVFNYRGKDYTDVMEYGCTIPTAAHQIVKPTLRC